MAEELAQPAETPSLRCALKALLLEAPEDQVVLGPTRFRDVPRLAQGEQYLLFTTAPSQYGLSVTVGLAKGCFDITGGMALNRAGNAGLFNGTAYAGPARGPIEYDELASRIRATIGTR